MLAGAVYEEQGPFESYSLSADLARIQRHDPTAEGGLCMLWEREWGAVHAGSWI